MLKVSLEHTFKSRKRKVLVQFSAALPSTGLIALYGESGIGKSTVLRSIAGLHSPDAGSIYFQNECWFDSDKKINTTPKERRLGIVFQDNNLFPNMNVQRNLTFVSPNNEISSAIHTLARDLQVEHLFEALPNQLSRGQQQRVALLRALSVSPQLLLLDEPFAALDDAAIEASMHALKTVQQNKPMLVLFVTHRKDVVHALADQVIIYGPKATRNWVLHKHFYQSLRSNEDF